MNYSTPCIAILPFVLPDWQQEADVPHLARGLARLIETRLRMIPESQVFVQHLLFAPDGDTGDKRFLVRTSMWSIDEALDLPTPEGVHPTHLLHGRLAWDDEIDLTIELIDVKAAFTCFRHQLRVPPSRFLGAFFPLLGKMAQATGQEISDVQRRAIEYPATTSFTAFHQYLLGLSQMVAHQLPLGEEVTCDEAFDYFLEALDRDPTFEDACLALDGLARKVLKRRKGNVVKAEYALREACHRAPHLASLRGTLGKYLFDCGHYQEARGYLEEFVMSGTGEDATVASAVVRLAAIYQVAESPDKLMAFLRESARRFPDHPDIQESLGICLTEAGVEKEAEECWRRVLEHHPYRSTSLSNLGQIHWSRGEHDKATVLLRRSIESLSPSPVAYQRFLDFLEERGRDLEADEVATQWVETGSDNQHAWMRLAHIRRRRGDLDAAQYCLAQLEKLPPSPEDEEELAILRFSILHPKDYVTYQRATSLWLQRAKLPVFPREVQTNLEDRGLRELHDLAQRHPSVTFIWNALSERLVQLERYPSALAAQRQLVKLLPYSAAAHNTLGFLMVKLHQRNQAIDSFRRAVELAPRVLDYRTNLASALLEEDRLEEAQQQVEAARSVNPSDTLVRGLADEIQQRRIFQAQVANENAAPQTFWARLSHWIRAHLKDQ